jgi:arylformamidase
MKLIDLSHVIEDGMTTYPGLPGPQISEHMTFEESASHYAEGTEFSIATIRLVANTGTYLDTAAHRYRGGDDLSALPLDRCALLPGTVVDGGPEFGPGDFDDLALEGRAVLLRTGWDQYWATETYGDPSHPFLSEAGAQRLVALGVALVGIDSVNIDDTLGGARPAHSVLLGAEIPVVEHLTGLHELPQDGFRFTAVPPAVRGMATFPVRAFAVLD